MARQKVSERAFIDAAGAEVDRMEQATGARYTLVTEGPVNEKGDKTYTKVKDFDMQFGDAGKPETMFAVFGFWTKVGNVANSILNDDKEPGDINEAAAEVEAWLGGVSAGTWREASEGGTRGPKYDNEVLGLVLHAKLGEAAKGDAASYTARLASDKGYRAKVVARDDIKAAYWAEMQSRGVAKPQASTESLA